MNYLPMKNLYSISISINFIFYLPSFCGLYIWHFSALCSILMQLLTVISTIDDLNYPEKTDTYYIVNVPYVFSACWKVCVNASHWKRFICFLCNKMLNACIIGRLLGLFCKKGQGGKSRFCKAVEEMSYWRLACFPFLSRIFLLELLMLAAT